jgi:AcrR family transcriptional regulator
LIAGIECRMTSSRRRRRQPDSPGKRPERPIGATAPRRGGRPSRAEARKKGERILDIATRLFLSQGYGATSIEAVARQSGISKRTFYHRFRDKPELFVAVVHRIVDGMRPPADFPLLEGDIEEILQRLARLILRAALSAPALALNRMLIAESAKFPRLAAIMAERGGSEEAIRLIAAVLEREARAGALTLTDSAFVARQFLYMVIAVPQRRAMGFGAPMTPREADAWASNVVNLLLNGCRYHPRDRRSAGPRGDSALKPSS